MNTGTIISLIILLVLYLSVSEFYIKRMRKIKNKWMGTLGKDRKRIFVILEWCMIIAFLLSTASLIDEKIPAIVRFIPMFSMFFILGIIRGLELWIYHRESRSYIHEWIGSLTILASYFILLFGEGL